MKSNFLLKLSGLFLLIGLILFISTGKVFSDRSQFIGKEIKSIEFQGNKNTSTSDIKDLLEMRVGSKLDPIVLNNDIKALFATGYFFYIDAQGEIEGDGVKIIFILRERPRVAEIEFIGADEVFPSDLREKIPVKENEVITPKKLAISKDLIIQKYRDEGFFLAYVKTEVSDVDEKTNTVVVKFIIDEGEEIPVSKINIFGNRQVDTYEILNILELKEAGFLEGGTFKESTFETDKQKIVGLLKSKGFIDAELSSDGTNWEIRWENPSRKDKRVIIVNYKISEG
ncbi:MAG: outer membrane protein assembly factor, partial [Leptospira sp.]|nr:outer membrane protein assembly factor [Leptospira sp.]